MGQLLLFIVVAVVVAAIVFGVTVMLSGGDSGLTPVEADGRAVPLPSDRPLGEDDIGRTRFDVAWRGYRMAEVDALLNRLAEEREQAEGDQPGEDDAEDHAGDHAEAHAEGDESRPNRHTGGP
jgi:DivIVA domain-containing protein